VNVFEIYLIICHEFKYSVLCCNAADCKSITKGGSGPMSEEVENSCSNLKHMNIKLKLSPPVYEQTLMQNPEIRVQRCASKVRICKHFRAVDESKTSGFEIYLSVLSFGTAVMKYTFTGSFVTTGTTQSERNESIYRRFSNLLRRLYNSTVI
jgi:hypothetical protein